MTWRSPIYRDQPIAPGALIDAGEEPDGIRGTIPNSASEARGGAVGASLIGDAARGGLSWSRYETSSTAYRGRRKRLSHRLARVFATMQKPRSISRARSRRCV